MRMLFFLAVFSCVSIFSGCSMQPVESSSEQLSTNPAADALPLIKNPVLVELFTSEGCSSCPPADKALTFLQQQQPVAKAEIITLAFHVDYWDRLGWKDEFALPLFSQRQQIYASTLKLDSSYTPQMVVDGHDEFVGSDLGKANKAIGKAALAEKGATTLSFEAGRLTVKIEKLPTRQNATVYLAIAESGLSSNVARGENQGQNLEHSSVVRELKTLGSVGPGDASFEASTAVELLPNWKAENLKLVVFVQENLGRKIIAVGHTASDQKLPAKIVN